MKTQHFSALIALLTLLQLESAWAETIGLASGRDIGTNAAYAAFVSSDGTITQITSPNLIPNGSIDSCSYNVQGAGLFGGRAFVDENPGYAGYLRPDGTVIALSGANFPSVNGEIRSVAINNSGAGLLCGDDNTGTGPGYGAYVFPDGTLTELTGSGFPSTSGSMSMVAINNSGEGIIGGLDATGSFPAYAAFVAPNGSLTQITGSDFPLTSSIISAVAINDQAVGLIGGGSFSGEPYVAFVTSDGAQPSLSGPGFPGTNNACTHTAINNGGNGIFAALDYISSPPIPYVALVASDGTLTPLSGVNFPSIGIIDSVAINASNEALIGGIDLNGAGPAYAARISPDGAITLLSSPNFPSISGEIFTVAINNAGLGIIGGQNYEGSEAAYGAIVAPDGTLTEFTGATIPQNNGLFESVSLPQILNALTPQAFSSFLSQLNSQLAASFALNSRLIKKFSPSFKANKKELSFLASNTKQLPLSQSSKTAPLNTIWTAPFGDLIYQQEEGNNPSYSNQIAGLLLGYDHAISNLLLGLLGGYGFNYFTNGPGTGHGNIQEEMISFYGTYERTYLRLNFALWGGIYQLHNKRHTLAFASSTAHTHGWIFSPHFEAGVPFPIKNTCSLQPFAMFDWAASWQNAFRETGPSGLNLQIPNHFGSLLRSEVGLRIFEEWQKNYGLFFFGQKVSYINQAPFGFSPTTTSFVGSASTFPIAIGSSQVQNLAGFELSASLIPTSSNYPYLTFDFQGEFGSSFQSYFANLEVGKTF